MFAVEEDDGQPLARVDRRQPRLTSADRLKLAVGDKLVAEELEAEQAAGDQEILLWYAHEPCERVKYVLEDEPARSRVRQRQ